MKKLVFGFVITLVFAFIAYVKDCNVIFDYLVIIGVIFLLSISYRFTIKRPISSMTQSIPFYFTLVFFAALYALTVGNTLTAEEILVININYWSWVSFTVIAFIAVVGLALFINEIAAINKPENSPESKEESKSTDNPESK